MNVEDLEKLARLRDAGAISEEEFNQGKYRLLTEGQEKSGAREEKFGLSDSTYYMLMHLSQLGSFLIPFSGIVAAVVLWVMNKEKDPIVDAHGRTIVNWNLSLLVYFCVWALLFFSFLGLFLLWVPLLLTVIFAIIGAKKASQGEVWKYPLSIPFF